MCQLSADRSTVQIVRPTRQNAHGIAIETLIESIVIVTIRLNDNAPSASDAATALVRREEATGGAGRVKPDAAPGDRIMAVNPSNRGRIARYPKNSQHSQARFGRNLLN